MNIFFGKISKIFDPKQIEEGYYISPKGTSWYGDLNIGDYVYLIGGDRIQFWRAKEWGVKDEEECLFFDILNPDLGIKISQLSMLKFLKMTKALVVMTSRSAKNKAFFKLEVTKEVTPEYLADNNTYLDDQIFRKIRVEKDIDTIEETEDIIVYYENENLKLYPSKFIEKSILEGFRDNTKYIGLGSVMKDNVISYFKNNTKTLPTILDPNKISLRSFYDTFFCEYKEKTKYFLVGAFWDTSNPQDQTERFMQEGIWFNGYEDKFQEEVNNVPVGSNIAIKAAFVREKTKSVMTIKARGVVIENLLDGQTLKVDWEEDFTPFEVNFGGYMRTIKEVVKAEHIKSIWSPEIYNLENAPEVNSIQKNHSNMDNFPLNQILYGPPGTGKTYKLKHEFFSKFIESSKAISKEEFLVEKISRLTWWQVIALTLYVENKEMSVPLIKEHQFIKIKFNASNSESIDQTLWGQLSQHTIKESVTVDYTKRTDPLIFDKSSESVWKIIPVKKELINDICVLGDEIKNFKNKLETKNNFEFITFHQSFTYEDFIEGIKPRLNEENQENSDLSYFVKDGIFYKCCDEAAKLAGFSSLSDCILNYTTKQRKEKFNDAPPFALFIDEINRGNVSAIFGELITLIEVEKRLSEDEIIVKLPYSERYFSVPPNLFIIGTMNTADRSVEALDTALRRRFCFTELMPEPQLLEGITFSKFNLKEVLETINARIVVLLDRDHTIGHSYFMQLNSHDTKGLKGVFENNIIPLLQEYFYHDYEKIALVLGEGFVSLPTDSASKVRFAKFSATQLETPDKGKRFELKKEITDIEAAIEMLLNRE